MFFLEVEVLRAPQSNRPCDVYQHVAFDFGCADLCVGPAAVVASVRTECVLLRFHVYQACFIIF